MGHMTSICYIAIVKKVIPSFLDVLICLLQVGTSAGVVASYANRPIFPESCRDGTMDDKSTYTTMIRIAGSFSMNGPVFEAITEYYGWKRFILLSDTKAAPCLYNVAPIYSHFDHLDNYSVYWIRFSDSPTDAEIDDCLQLISERARGMCCLLLPKIPVRGVVWKWKSITGE